MEGAQITKLASIAARAAGPAAKVKKASQEIEAIFVKDLMAAMRKTAQHKSLGNSLGGDMYQDMFDQAISDGASKTGTLGIAQTIFRQMAPQAIRAALSTGSIVLPTSGGGADRDDLTAHDRGAHPTKARELDASGTKKL